MFNESRPIRVFAGDKEIAKELRVVTKGRSNMTLLPDFFMVDLYNLSDEDYAIISHSKKLKVYVGQNSLVCCGEIEGIYNHDSDSNKITSVSVSDGMGFWTSSVNFSIGKGAHMKDVVERLVGKENLGAFIAKDVRLTRGQAFYGNPMDYVNDIAISVDARAFITNGVLFILEKGKIINTYTLYEENLIRDPDYAGETIIVKTYASGYSIGGLVYYNNKQYRIITQTINLDNMDGEWSTEMVLLNESHIQKEEMGGGW